MYSISAVIPTYNSRELVTDAIDSALAQTYPVAEIIVIDDGSEDGTGEELARRYGNRIRYYRQANGGPSAARNAGIARSTGDWVAFLDADDSWMPDKLEAQVEALRAEPAAVMAVAGCLKVSPEGRIISENKLPQPLDNKTIRMELRKRTLFPMNGLVVRRDMLEKCRGFDTALRCGEDRDLWIRLVVLGPVAVVHRPLARQLTHQESLSSNPEWTLRDGLIVNRRAQDVLGGSRRNALARGLELRRVNARLYLSVAWLYGWRNRRREAVSALIQSWMLWPWPGLRVLKGQVGFLLQMLRRRPIVP